MKEFFARCDVVSCAKDADGHYVFANDSFLTEFCDQQTFRLGATDADLFPEPEAQRLRANDAVAWAATGACVHAEVFCSGDQQRTFVFNRFVFTAEGRAPTLGVVGFALPAGEGVVASNAMFKGILDIAIDAIISVDDSQQIILFNQGAAKIFGYAAEEVLGQPLEILLPPNARAMHQHHLAQFAKAPVGARPMGERGAIAGRRKDGSVFPAEASISRIRVGGRTTYTAILRDVTQARAAEAAIQGLNTDLNHRATQLENANRELEAFSYSVSHDLRAPLRSIDGFSQVLIEDFRDVLPPEAQDSLNRIRAASQRMAQLIDDMLALSRFTRGAISRRDVDLTAMAMVVADELKAAEPQRAVVFEAAPGVVVDADPHLIRVVLTNLLGNAWKYTSKHPTAHVTVGKFADSRGRSVVFVRDDGAGFDMAYANKLFGVFQRLHAMHEYAGNGVGLATVQRIIHKHGGEVWAEGVVEHGATFYFTLN